MENLKAMPTITRTMTEIRTEFEILKKRTFQLSRIVDQFEHFEYSDDKENKKHNYNVGSKAPKSFKNKNKEGKITKSKTSKAHEKRFKKLKNQKTQTKDLPYFYEPIKKNPPCADKIVNKKDLVVYDNLCNVQTSTTRLYSKRANEVLLKIEEIQGDSWDNEIFILLIPEKRAYLHKTKLLNVVVVSKVYKTQLGSFVIEYNDLGVINRILKKYSVAISNRHIEAGFNKDLFLDQVVKAETAKLMFFDTEENKEKPLTIAEIFERINAGRASDRDFDELFDIANTLKFQILLRPNLMSEDTKIIVEFFFLENYYMGTLHYSDEAFLKQIQRKRCLLNRITFIYDACEYLLPNLVAIMCRSFARLTRSMWLYDCFGELVFDMFKGFS